MAQPPQEVVVIDDSGVVREALIEQLTRLGFAARGAEDGVRGIAEIQRQQPAIVLCDLRMPKMDGLEFMRVVRQLHPELPVIVMSGAGLLADAISALKLGAWDYITKPISEDAVLKHAIDKALERVALLAENRNYRARLEEANRQLRNSLFMLADDVNAARQIQLRMLPRNDQQFGRFQFSRELVASAYLSGDFIDAFTIDARRFGFYLADVAGHGVSSALITVLLRTLVQRQVAAYARTTEGEVALSPGRLLASLNEEILKEGLDKHLTIFFGVIDTVDDTLVYANGGHFPWPILYDGTTAVQLEKPGVPVGMFAGSSYPDHAIALPQKLVLAVFSDGLLDMLPHPSLDEKTAVLRQAFGRLEVTIDGALTELGLSARSSLPDDVAVVLIKGG